MKVFPESWKILPANEVCSEIVDCLNKTAPVVERDTGYRMIRTTNVRNGVVDISDTKFVEEVVFRKWTRRARPIRGDIILTREAPLGEVGILRSDANVFLGQRTVLYRANPQKLDQRFLYYQMSGPYVKTIIQTKGSGATVEHLRVPDAENLPIPVAPLNVQKKIAAILSAYDELIENNKRRITLLEKLAEEIYREWFVRLRFPGHENVKVIKGVPNGWEVRAIGSFADEIKRGVKKKNLADDEKYVGLEHIPRHSIALRTWTTANTVESDKLLFQERDILFGKIRPYLHKVVIAHFSGACSSDTIVLRPKERHYEGYLLFTVFSDTFVELATVASKGTKMPRADWSFLKKLQLIVPDEELLERYQAQFDIVFRQIANLLNSNRLLSTSRDLLLPRLISGKLSVGNLDIRFHGE